MGTGQTVPQWFAEILWMERFSCTERELYEDFRRVTIERIGATDAIRGRVNRIKEAEARLRAQASR